MNASTAGSSGAGVGGAGAGGAAGTLAGSAGTSGAGGAAGSGLPMCPMDPPIMMCGSESCPAVASGPAMICVRNCCTADTKCGTHNAALNTECMALIVNTSMCPDEMLGGTPVTGCCVEGGNECGIVDPILGMGCLGRTDPRVSFFGMLDAMNCDGTPVMMGEAGAGGAGTGGAGGAGTGGAGGAGTGGAGTGGAGGAGTGGTGGMQ